MCTRHMKSCNTAHHASLISILFLRVEGCNYIILDNIWLIKILWGKCP